jgi:hypothetical protein
MAASPLVFSLKNTSVLHTIRSQQQSDSPFLSSADEALVARQRLDLSVK